MVDEDANPHRQMRTARIDHEEIEVAAGPAINGIRLYPAMPYPSYAKMPDRDIDDL